MNDEIHESVSSPLLDALQNVVNNESLFKRLVFKAFNIVDESKKGILTREELMNTIKSVGKSSNMKELTSNEEDIILDQICQGKKEFKPEDLYNILRKLLEYMINKEKQLLIELAKYH